MVKNYFLQNDGTFVIKNYNSVPPFSNFLPGISGEWGIPLWVFYVNRAQGVVSFGIKDKDHSISEFFPANKAYSLVSSFGFRTFLKINHEIYYEPFKINPQEYSQAKEEEMFIRSASFELKETNPTIGLCINVRYFTLPNTPVGGLVRVVSLKNISKKIINLEAIDGLGHIIPFGSIYPFLKDISHTLEAWMHSRIDDNLAIFRLIVDPRDTSHTKYIEGANFNYSFYEDKGKKVFPQLIVDPRVVFGQNTSHIFPEHFLDKNFKMPASQIKVGKTPSAFSYFKWSILPGEERILYSVFGAAFKLDLIKEFLPVLDADFLKEKEAENEYIIKELKEHCLCVSGLKNFDYYAQYTYLDNVLRGGYPYCIDSSLENNNKLNHNGRNIYYIFSRKHGDLERDYNYFQLLPSYFSEGEANYRDINQNRRTDLFFEPALKAKNIVYFLNFVKIDGYNPLVIKGEKLYFSKQKAQAFLEEFNIKSQRLFHLLLRGFCLGEFFSALQEEQIKLSNREALLAALLSRAEREPQGYHGEGYWIDHWRYNLDLIESFLYLYPDKLKELFLEQGFLFWDDEYRVKKRSSRYILRGTKPYQSESLEVVKEKKTILRNRKGFKNFLRTRKGKIYKTNLCSKLLAIILNKAATLDPEGVGIEMEADKPGWCDSLNGLPALFGSSLCETFELKRASLLLLGVLRKLKAGGVKDIPVPQEVFLFFKQLNTALGNFLSSESKNRNYVWWDRSNLAKEDFRQKTFFYTKGTEKKLSLLKLEKFLENLTIKLDIGIKKAKDKKTGLPLTYFIYEITKYQPKNKHIIPLEFKRKALPLFLEGVVHALRTEGNKKIYYRVRKSKLFDKKLKMYRLNASLARESLEIGRSRAFVPGWLENESVWLHMEYKYLLELLKNGLHEEFFNDFYNCCVCFFDPAHYGRNILENSSFIVSTTYPDSNLWGRGFVARLSGATAEFLNIWMLLCLGRNPFSMHKNKGLILRFSPILKKEFFTTVQQAIDFKCKKIILPENTFSFKLFAKTLVCYHNPKRKDTFSKNCQVKKIVITTQEGKIAHLAGVVTSPFSELVRRKEAERIDVYFE